MVMQNHMNFLINDILECVVCDSMFGASTQISNLNTIHCHISITAPSSAHSFIFAISFMFSHLFLSFPVFFLSLCLPFDLPSFLFASSRYLCGRERVQQKYIVTCMSDCRGLLDW
jgi:hypothetical protein